MHILYIFLLYLGSVWVSCGSWAHSIHTWESIQSKHMLNKLTLCAYVIIFIYKSELDQCS